LIIPFAFAVACRPLPLVAAPPITVAMRNFRVAVNDATCRWWVYVKGIPMRMNDVHFLPGDDPSGWSMRLRHHTILEKQNHPVLISTSRHVRQMAFDIKDLAYDSRLRVLRGASRAVAGDPYQLRVYVPEGFTARRAELTGNMPNTTKTDGPLLTVDFIAPNGDDVDWKIIF
jgi:hypothetical protein